MNRENTDSRLARFMTVSEDSTRTYPTMTAIHIKRPPALTFRAGGDALAHIRRQGFAPQDVRLIPGAAVQVWPPTVTSRSAVV